MPCAHPPFLAAYVLVCIPQVQTNLPGLCLTACPCQPRTGCWCTRSAPSRGLALFASLLMCSFLVSSSPLPGAGEASGLLPDGQGPAAGVRVHIQWEPLRPPARYAARRFCVPLCSVFSYTCSPVYVSVCGTPPGVPVQWDPLRPLLDSCW